MYKARISKIERLTQNLKDFHSYNVIPPSKENQSAIISLYHKINSKGKYLHSNIYTDLIHSFHKESVIDKTGLAQLQREKDEVIATLQQLLDQQATVLLGHARGHALVDESNVNDQNGGNIYKIRIEILQCMKLLRDLSSRLIDFYNREENLRNEWIGYLSLCENVRSDAEKSKIYIHYRSNSAKEYESIEDKIYSIDNEISDLKSTIKSLEKKKRQLEYRREELSSIMASKASIYEDYQLEVDKAEYKYFDFSYSKNNDTIIINKLVTLAMDIWKLDIGKFSEAISNEKLENSALNDGIDIWNEFQDFLKNVELKIQTVQAKDNEYDNKDAEDTENKTIANEEIIGIIKKTILYIKGVLTIATSKNWTLLIVAISHELQAFEQAVELLKTNPLPRNT